MNCPVCKTTELKMSERQGIEIDYCPQCRGVWLDRGELDKIIERATADEAPARPASHSPSHPAPPPPRYEPRSAPPSPPHYDPNDDSKYGYPYRKKKSFWREIFDF